MKRYLFLFLIVTIYGCREQANRPARTIPRTSVASYSNPLLTSGADPYAIYHDGVYYYTQSIFPSGRQRILPTSGMPGAKPYGSRTI